MRGRKVERVPKRVYTRRVSARLGQGLVPSNLQPPTPLRILNFDLQGDGKVLKQSGLPDGSVRNLSASARVMGSIPDPGRFPRAGEQLSLVHNY